jgi:hypothetical protein
MRKKMVVALALATIAVVVSSCQLGQVMYASCNKAADGNPFGADSTRVLVCENNVWKPIMTMDEYIRILQKQSVTLSPEPVAPEVPLCWNFTVGGQALSLRYNGVLNTADNGAVFEGSDCQGAVDSSNTGAIVWANDQATAQSLCVAIDPTLTSIEQGNDELDAPRLPATMWLCDTAA